MLAVDFYQTRYVRQSIVLTATTEQDRRWLAIERNLGRNQHSNSRRGSSRRRLSILVPRNTSRGEWSVPTASPTWSAKQNRCVAYIVYMPVGPCRSTEHRKRFWVSSEWDSRSNGLLDWFLHRLPLRQDYFHFRHLRPWNSMHHHRRQSYLVVHCQLVFGFVWWRPMC